MPNVEKARPYPSTSWFADRYPLPREYPITPAGIQRNIQLAAVLEPLICTPDKTTRWSDLNRHQRFTYFLTAGVNIGEAFRSLGERLVREKAENPIRQPLIYDLSLIARIDSKRQRSGGRTNFGIIAMLMPIVASQVLYLDEPPNPNNIGRVFLNVETVLKNTSVRDVESIQAMEELAYTLSHIHHRRGETELYSGETVYDYYQAKQRGVKRVIYDEFMSNFSTSQRIVHEVLNIGRQGNYEEFQDIFSDIFLEACARVRRELPESYTAAQMADNTAVALYILLSHFSDSEIVF